MYNKIICSLAVLFALVSCFKEEPLNMEADILQAQIHLDEPLTVFYNAADTLKNVPYSGNGDSIIFIIRPSADITALAPTFEVSEGATVSPASGTVRDFSKGSLPYTVTSADGNWQRTYLVGFSPLQSVDHYSLDDGRINEETGKYYEWPGLCSANQGFMVARSSATPEEYPTIYDPNGYIGGCAQLRTVSTGSWGAMTNKRLAAGNLYTGTFDMSKALTQTLQATHFGIPVDRMPSKYRGYYRYRPGEKMQDKSGKFIEGTDSCAIYAVFYRNHDANGKEIYLTGEDIMTNPNIVAIAKYYDIPATETWKEFSLDFKYTKEVDYSVLADHGYSLTIVCSASKDGDLFQGAVGSTLWVDELNVVFEERR